MLKIAINGYGRIGRSFVRALAEREAAGNALPVRLVAINDLGRAEDLLYLTRYDTTHGRLNAPAELVDGCLRIGDQALGRGTGSSRKRAEEAAAAAAWAQLHAVDAPPSPDATDTASGAGTDGG